MPHDFLVLARETWLATGFLAIIGTVWTLGSIRLLANPRALTSDLGIESRTASGWVELRSIYGGSMLGFALLMLAAAFYPPWRYPVLVGTVALNAMPFLVRIYSLRAEAPVAAASAEKLMTPTICFYLIFELGVSLLSLILLYSGAY